MPPPMSLPYLTAPRWSWVPGARGRAGLLFSGLLAMGLCLAGPLQASSGIEREQLEALVDWHLPSAVADVQTWVRVPTVTAPPGSDTGADKTALPEASATTSRPEACTRTSARSTWCGSPDTSPNSRTPPSLSPTTSPAPWWKATAVGTAAGRRPSWVVQPLRWYGSALVAA